MSSNPVANGGYDGPLSPIAPEDDVTFALSPRATFETEGKGPHVVTVLPGPPFHAAMLVITLWATYYAASSGHDARTRWH